MDAQLEERNLLLTQTAHALEFRKQNSFLLHIEAKIIIGYKIQIRIDISVDFDMEKG